MFDLTNIIDIAIDDELRHKLCFRENLIIGKFECNGQNEIPVPVGGMCLDIQAAHNDKLLVFMSSKFNVEDATGGSKITAWLDAGLHTIEEKRTEFLAGGELQRRSLYVGAQAGRLHVHATSTAGRPRGRAYPAPAVSHLVAEGANFALLRLLALSQYSGQFEMSTLYINGDLCRNIYRCSGPEGGEGGVCRVQRTVVERCGLVHECSSTLTCGGGRLVRQEWRGCGYALHCNPLEAAAAAGGGEQRPWPQDVQLFSAYLDRRRQAAAAARTYLHDRPELADLLADYVKALLQHRPSRVLDFTTDHFVRYASVFR